IQPTIQAQNTATADPNTPENKETASPTALGGAPEETFTGVGNTATFEGLNDTEGKAVVAGLQTLIILGFRFDGKVKADIRLVKGTDYAKAIHIFTELDRAYDAEVLQFTIPANIAFGSADTIAVYDTETNQVLAAAIFR
ncbi:MAG: hypothetical protein ACYCZF_15830, partial [Anaerolineae bacterium]